MENQIAQVLGQLRYGARPDDMVKDSLIAVIRIYGYPALNRPKRRVGVFHRSLPVGGAGIRHVKKQVILPDAVFPGLHSRLPQTFHAILPRYRPAGFQRSDLP